MAARLVTYDQLRADPSLLEGEDEPWCLYSEKLPETTSPIYVFSGNVTTLVLCSFLSTAPLAEMKVKEGFLYYFQGERPAEKWTQWNRNLVLGAKSNRNVGLSGGALMNHLTIKAPEELIMAPDTVYPIVRDLSNNMWISKHNLRELLQAICP